MLFVPGFSAAYAQEYTVQTSGKEQSLFGLTSEAVRRGYQAAVLLWEIDPETGNRLSAQFSGVVITASGEILSAAHVVMPGKVYQVMFPDGKVSKARGRGRITIPPAYMLPDAAKLQITEAGPWPFAEMGWSSSLILNEPCISIAYPESLEQRKPTVRFGRITSVKNQYGFLQSSCVMEPGDSGGPLFDLHGRVIGIHSGIEISESINYEVPIDIYRKYKTALDAAENYSALPAQTDTFSGDSLENKRGNMPSNHQLFKALQYVNAKMPRSVFHVKSSLNGTEQEILGTLIAVPGILTKTGNRVHSLILSKNSMVGDNIFILSPGHKKIKAQVMSRNLELDLILLLPEENMSKGLTLLSSETKDVEFSELGKFLFSPLPDSPSVISVLSSTLINLPKITSYGYLGAVASIKGDYLVVTHIQNGSAAEESGLQIGDIIKSVDKKPVEDQLDFLKALQRYRAGDTTILKIVRGETLHELIARLHYPPSKVSHHPAELFAGGKSIRRDGFDQVFVHDGSLKANQCGGPLFNESGKFMGINIARLSRTSTVVIPASTLTKLLADYIKDHNTLRW